MDPAAEGDCSRLLTWGDAEILGGHSYTYRTTIAADWFGIAPFTPEQAEKLRVVVNELHSMGVKYMGYFGFLQSMTPTEELLQYYPEFSPENAGLADARAKVQAALNAYRGYIQDSLNAGLGDARDKAQSALNSSRGYIQDSLNKGLLDARQKVQIAFTDFRERLQANFNETIISANRSLASFRDSSNTSLETLRASTEANINASADKLRASVEDAFNSLIPTLWTMEGIPEGVLMTPTVYRNITPTGFDILSLGKMTASYIALGVKA